MALKICSRNVKVKNLELEKNDNDNFEVVNLVFMGPAEQKGMDFFDEVTRIEISSLDRPAKEYVYLVELLVLLLTWNIFLYRSCNLNIEVSI